MATQITEAWHFQVEDDGTRVTRTFQMMPYYGSSYNPMTMTIATLFMTIIVYALSNLPRLEHAFH